MSRSTKHLNPIGAQICPNKPVLFSYPSGFLRSLLDFSLQRQLMEPDLTLEVRHDTSMFPVPPTGSAAWASAQSVSAFQNVAGDTGTSRAS